jgi:hypothetical protein
MYHDKDVLDVEVKCDIPQDVGLHFVARPALHDKDRPKKILSSARNAQKKGECCNTHGFPIVMHIRTYGFRRDSYESIHE